MPEIQDLNDWDRRIIEEFRANGGNVGGQFAGVPFLLLTTTGAKSGEPRTRPLVYLRDAGRIYVFAGNRGAPTNPAWYHNLVAHPDVTVELGTEKFEAKAIIVDSAEGDRLGSIQVQKIPALASLAARITRKVPVILLARKKERERTTEKVKALPLGFPHRVKGPAMSHSFLMREKLPFIW